MDNQPPDGVDGSMNGSMSGSSKTVAFTGIVIVLASNPSDEQLFEVPKEAASYLSKETADQLVETIAG
jgi:hypothetical protein